MPDTSFVQPLLEAAVTPLIAFTLWTAGLGMGMSIRAVDIIESLGRRRLVAGTIVLDIVLVPFAMWAMVQLLQIEDGLATGLLLVAFASAGPLGIKLAAVAGAETAYAIGIVVVLELANIVIVPAWVAFLGVATGREVVTEIIVALVVFVLLPIGVGQAIGRIRRSGAERWVSLAVRASSVGLALTIATIVARDIQVVSTAITSAAGLAAAAVVGFALVAGWFIGGPERPTRLATSLVTGTRANAVALAVASTAFAAEPQVLTGALTAGLVSITLPGLLAVVVSRWRESPVSVAQRPG